MNAVELQRMQYELCMIAVCMYWSTVHEVSASAVRVQSQCCMGVVSRMQSAAVYVQCNQ
jgi:hypothetical protein